MIFSVIFFIIFLAIFIDVQTRDSANNRSADIRFKVRLEERKTFFRKYEIDSELAHEIDNAIIRMDDDVVAVFKEIKKVIKLKPTKPMLKFAMCASLGKVPSMFEIDTNDSPFGDRHDVFTWRLPVWTGQDLHEQTPSIAECKEARRKFLIWYDIFLRGNGFPYKLLYSPIDDDECQIEKEGGLEVTKNIKHDKCYVEDAKWIGDFDEIKRGVGFWSPIRHGFNVLPLHVRDVQSDTAKAYKANTMEHEEKKKRELEQIQEKRNASGNHMV